MAFGDPMWKDCSNPKGRPTGWEPSVIRHGFFASLHTEGNSQYQPVEGKKCLGFFYTQLSWVRCTQQQPHYGIHLLEPELLLSWRKSLLAALLFLHNWLWAGVTGNPNNKMDKKFGVGHFYHGWVFHVFAVYCYVTNSSQTDLLKAATVFYSAC